MLDITPTNAYNTWDWYVIDSSGLSGGGGAIEAANGKAA